MSLCGMLSGMYGYVSINENYGANSIVDIVIPVCWIDYSPVATASSVSEGVDPGFLNKY